MFKKLAFLCLSLFLLPSHAQGVSVSVLRGDNFRDDLGYRSSKTTLTIENFSMWDYGTVFFYYDITEPTGNDQGPDYYSNQFFGGIAPTVSLSKLTGKDWSWGILKDVQLRAELENGSGNGYAAFRNYFYGLQYDLAVPGFDFISFNTVIRDNPEVAGVGFQIGGFWQMSWEYGPWRKFKFTGFFATSPWDGNNNNKDFAPLDPKGRFFTAQPQFLWDVGLPLTGKANQIEVGVEYAYFLKRFQFEDKDEKCLQGMVKVSF